jgi:hypothetical protein
MIETTVKCDACKRAIPNQNSHIAVMFDTANVGKFGFYYNLPISERKLQFCNGACAGAFIDSAVLEQQHYKPDLTPVAAPAGPPEDPRLTCEWNPTGYECIMLAKGLTCVKWQTWNPTVCGRKHVEPK